MVKVMPENKQTPSLEVFLTVFPEFESYGQGRCEYFLSQAINSVSDGRFGKETDYGRMLFAAHHLTILGSGEDTSAKATELKRPIASKAVGSANVSYDTGTGTDAEAGEWNLTKYGRLFWALLKRYRRLPTIVVGRSTWP
jgi:hypothetical protein|nr:MAG TPA: head to tail adaptor [Caudoviricetes sp.]